MKDRSRRIKRRVGLVLALLGALTLGGAVLALARHRPDDDAGARAATTLQHVALSARTPSR